MPIGIGRILFFFSVNLLDGRLIRINQSSKEEDQNVIIQVVGVGVLREEIMIPRRCRVYSGLNPVFYK